MSHGRTRNLPPGPESGCHLLTVFKDSEEVTPSLAPDRSVGREPLGQAAGQSNPCTTPDPFNGFHLASLELAHQVQIISCEEYSPYGSTPFQAVRIQTETPKRYRYTGKERDEGSGLHYHGARYDAV
jgi:hypothetical protein